MSEAAADLSVVIFADDHTPMLRGSIWAAERAVRWAREGGYVVNCAILIRDSQRRAERWARHMLDPKWDRIRCADAGRGVIRNTALAATNGRYVAFADASDLWSANWLLAAMRGVIAEGGIWRPEALITFSGDHFSTEGRTLRLFSDADGEMEALLGTDTLPTGFLCAREVFQTAPFPEEDPSRGYGEVDWWWNCSAAAAGFRHRIMPGTFHYRHLLWSSLTQTAPDARIRSRFGPIPLAG